MASISIFQRKERHGVLLSLTDHFVQLARLSGLDERPLTVDRFIELPVGDEEAVTRWLREAFPDHNSGYLPGYCSFHPHERLLLRVSAAGGAHPVGLKGPTQFATARRLAKLGLGVVEDRRFTANERGVAVVTENE